VNSHPGEEAVEAAQLLAAEVCEKGGRAQVFPADISLKKDVDEMFARCECDLGAVDVLVLNAAATERHSWLEISEAEWDHVLAVNLKGAFLCCQRAFPQSRTVQDAAIITISSVLAKIGAANALHYASSKAGLLGFTRSLARELGPRSVRVNCVMPGAIQTEEELQSFPDQEAVAAELSQLQFLKRRGKAADVAAAVSFLAGPDSSFMTGQIICVDGGWLHN
jgi:NAD(P)-dependent dehydrogenase (short-subunit alcohol dehydrogenase family)